MHLLILNWRDVRSPRAGGAEHVTHAVARELVQRGWQVTWLSSGASGLPVEEDIDGVTVLRRGSELTTRASARGVARDVRPDIILEEINTLPYFAPVWARVPVLLYMNQLAREVWWYEAPLPLAAIGRLSESAYLRVYRRCDAITISASSRDDLRAVGVRGTITIAPMLSHIEVAASLPPKTRHGSLIAIGRLTPSKRYDEAIRALAGLRHTHPAATLTLIGEGRSRGQLERLANSLDLRGAVVFAGRVTDEEKIRLLDESDVLVGTSVREGWGLTITEAAARGTPSVVYDIPGFRDAVIAGRTGLLVQPEPAALADALARLMDDPARYEGLRVRAWQSAAESKLDATANAFEAALRAALQ